MDEPTPDELRRLLAEGGGSEEDRALLDEVLSRRELGASALKLGTLSMLGLLGRGMLPAAWAEEVKAVPGKSGMTIHVARPMSGEFAAHLLDDSITPTARHFVRNNGLVPDRARARDARGWSLRIDGHVERELTLDLAELKRLPAVTMPLIIECGGNGRAFFSPRVRGNPWGRGAVACASWTGVRLRDVLKKAGVKAGAVYTAHYGADTPLGAAEPFSRGVPIEKAMEEHTLLAYAMNGEDLHPLNGFPLRLVVPGWVGSTSQKWLTRISVLDRVHDSQKMRGYSYRIPRHPVTPGTRPPKQDMEIATAWRIKSLITSPAEGAKLKAGAPVPVRGHAWAGDGEVEKVLVSIDYGVHWTPAKLEPPPNRYSWARWTAAVTFPGRGYHEVWARAFDRAGDAQPFHQPWNPKGYLGNVVHRLPVTVEA